MLGGNLLRRKPSVESVGRQNMGPNTPGVCLTLESPGRSVLCHLPENRVSPSACGEVTVKKDKEQPMEGGKDGLGFQEPFPEMRAPTPETAQLLYQGFSHEGEGRRHYLKERKMKSPEEKFCYPVLSSWEYGWRLGDVLKDIGTPTHGKSRIVKDTFYFKNGIFYHPSKTDRLS